MSGLDLYQTQRALALLFVYAAVAGAILGGVYDAFRILRVFCGEDFSDRAQESRKPFLAILRFALDLLFCLLFALSLILLCYYANDGQLRAPAVLGMAGGFFVYLQTLGRLTAKLAKPFVMHLQRALRLVLHLLWRPVRYASGLIAFLARFLWRVTVGKLLHRRREKQTEKAAEALIEAAKQGFGFSNTEAQSQRKK